MSTGAYRMYLVCGLLVYSLILIESSVEWNQDIHSELVWILTEANSKVDLFRSVRLISTIINSQHYGVTER